MKGASVTINQVLKGLDEMGYEVRPSKSGMVVAIVETTEVKINARRGREVADPGILSRISVAAGITTKELLEVFLGKTVANAGKPKTVMSSEPAVAPATKAELLGLVAEQRAHLGRIEEWLRRAYGDGELGVETQKTVLKLRSDLLTSVACLKAWPPRLPTDGTEWVQPDGKGYEPRRYDSVTTGAARATGDSARLAVRGTTATKGQLEERNA